MAKRKLEPHELRQLVEEERENILADLARVAEEDEAAREKEAKRQAPFRKQAGRLLLRGKGADLGRRDGGRPGVDAPAHASCDP